MSRFYTIAVAEPLMNHLLNVSAGHSEGRK